MTVILTHGEKVTCNKEVMNYLSIVFGEAAYRYRDMGLDALAERADEDADLIYNALNDVHFYD